MSDLGYFPRIIDHQLKEKMSEIGAVLIVGPKWCGKTTTAENIAKSRLYMQDPDYSNRYIRIASVKVSNLLVGENPRLIDEWQMAPNIWDAVRFSVDHRKETGLYILTGSTVVDREKIRHSGAGRIAILTMRTMSLFESGESSGEISLRGLFSGLNEVSGSSKLTISDIAELIVRGGWPAVALCENTRKGVVGDYCKAILNTEITVGGVKRDRDKMEKILRSLSRNIATSVSNAKILDDISQSEKGPLMSQDTLSDYLGALDDICVTDDMKAWCPKLRSRTTIRTSKTRYLADPAIAAYFLGASAKDLEYDPNTFGLLFEALVARDLRVYVQGLDGEVYHYRDRNGLEVDAILHLWNGKWGAVEVKLSDDAIDEAAKHLLSLKDKVEGSDGNDLSFLAVIVATGIAYTRDDGVHVIPIGCLRD